MAELKSMMVFGRRFLKPRALDRPLMPLLSVIGGPPERRIISFEIFDGKE